MRSVLGMGRGVFLWLLLGVPGAATAQSISFTDVTVQAGVAAEHGFLGPLDTMPKMISGGAAAGDYNRDGWVDLFVVRGELGPTLLYRNNGDGTFTDVASAAGVELAGGRESGPAFIDLDGDGWLDLVVGGIDGTPPRIFRNRQGGFAEITAATEIAVTALNTFSTAAGDYDGDGDLDLFLAHWTTDATPCPPGGCGQHLWRNDGDGTYTEVDGPAGVAIPEGKIDRTFTPNFADVNGDQRPDLLVCADFGSSRVLLNDGDGTFTDATDPLVQTDSNGMGATVGDFDNDGNLDWFISSIWDPEESLTGNRLYRGLGDGRFEEISEAAGVRDGSWGWGACAQDFNNDGHIDIAHVNGWGDPKFIDDAARLFANRGDGTYFDAATPAGLAETRQGRGIVCFDYDRDGDIDLFVANNTGATSLWRNDGGNRRRWLGITLKVPGANPNGVGARILVSAGGRRLMRELRAGSNFQSQDPTEAHFGVGSRRRITRLRVLWPGGGESEFRGVPTGRRLEVEALRVDGATRTYTAATAFPARPCTVCQVEARISLADLGGPDHTAAALMGWIAGPGDFVAATLDADADRVVLRQASGGAVVSRSIATAPIDLDTPYDLRIGYDGADFTVYLDDRPVLVVPNAAAGQPGGIAGLAVSDAAATLTNLTVARLNPL